MNSGNWIIDNIVNALNVWNDKLQEIWQIITQSPESFKGGGIWGIVLNINASLKATGYALLVLFFVVGIVKTCGSFAEVRRPEHAAKLFIRFILAKAVVGYGLDLMMALFRIVQGVISTTMDTAGLTAQAAVTMPEEMAAAIQALTFLAIHTGMGGQPNRQPCDYRTVIRNDNERLRALFQALSIHGYRPHSPIRLRRRAIRKYRKKLFEIICGSMP